MKNFIGISRDHSGSMRHIVGGATKDYNDNVVAIREQSIANNLDTIVTVNMCGVGRNATVVTEHTNTNILAIPILTSYVADGSLTPLWDAVGSLIHTLESAPGATEPDATFLVMIITDGGENGSRSWSAARLGQKIRELQQTDRWTFVFRVPRGYGKNIVNSLGVYPGNVLEWDQTERGIAEASAVTTTAVSDYYRGVSTGKTSSSTFFADLSAVSVNDVKKTLEDVSALGVEFIDVGKFEPSYDIRKFVEARTGQPLIKGAGFYQLTKSETVQPQKLIGIVDRATGAVYVGAGARQLLGLPTIGHIQLRPGNNGAFDIYVQSTSVNRKLVANTKLLYWRDFAQHV